MPTKYRIVELRKAYNTMEEWMGEAIKDNNADAKQAFGLSMTLISEELYRLTYGCKC